jgi:hypothetical protein
MTEILINLVVAAAVLTVWYWLAVRVFRLPEHRAFHRRPPVL